MKFYTEVCDKYSSRARQHEIVDINVFGLKGQNFNKGSGVQNYQHRIRVLYVQNSLKAFSSRFFYSFQKGTTKLISKNFSYTYFAIVSRFLRQNFTLNNFISRCFGLKHILKVLRMTHHSRKSENALKIVLKKLVGI